jgi:divalent metal cation (Fe/Co/Zn/Cd) transporter
MTKAIALARGKQLQYVTLTYNLLEAAIAIRAGALATSVSLIGFGLDSLIEVSASVAALWLLNDRSRERTVQRLASCSLVLLAAGTAYQALSRTGEAEKSLPGLGLAAVSIIVMPWLSREKKKKVAEALGSSALASEAKQTDFCFYLSVILLAAMIAQWLLGLAWIDSVAALAMTPLMLVEARRAWQGRSCAAGCGYH